MFEEVKETLNVIVAADWNNLDWSTTETREMGKREIGEKTRLERGLPLTACNFSIIDSSSCTCESAPSPSSSPSPCPCLSCSAREVCCSSKRGDRRFGSLDCVAPDFWLPRSASDFSIVPRIESNSESMSRSSLFGSSGSGDQSLASSASSRRGRPVFSITEAMER